ncbi:hypothetical protein KIW84_074284 [Lathyrus oleraceus]|uniref:Nucleic acid-binding protein n=1 Tax=Pisum sativum TaxID=3888 RepID=A0A9D4VTD9_PEA|nr:hypothetical protein KIW84_074284 [Pisum sativum]
MLLTLKHITLYATVATTKKLIASQFGWYYQACHQCPKAARGDITPFLCETGHFTESEMFRYKIKIEVYHAGKCCKFVFWDKECSQFLGVSAIQKRDTMIEDGIDDPLEFPLALDVFLGLEIAFKVKWHPQ